MTTPDAATAARDGRVEEILDAAKAERTELMKVVEAAMIYSHSTIGAQGRYAYQELEKACVRYGDYLDERAQIDYEYAPGELDWGLFAEGIDVKKSFEKVQQLIAEAKANGR
jgi:hypothetical protein